MASSSSESTSQWKYVVFLSFRGEDTRKTFTSYLFQSLKKRGIFTFLDDERLEHGDSIPKELMKAIEDSKAALIIFSKNYATSSWCLNELVKIMECKDRNGQIVIPIFYDVDPSHVRNQTESFAEAFAKHESSYKDDVEGMQKVQGWRNALTAAANLKGFDIRGGIEFDNIQKIVGHISKLCKSAYFLYSSQDIVGLDTHLEKVESILSKEIDGAQIVGIWGMGGIGKTTIATTIFHKYNLSGKFEAACILDDVKENATKNGLCSLQNILLSELLGEKDNYIMSKQVGKCMIPSRLSCMKVLIVLDDINHSDHLEYLAGDVGWFGKGSRVIVTTRDRDLLKINDDAIYEMKLLPDDEAMQLFNQHAFRKEVPDESFEKLSLEVVNHAKGLPLALKVWGGSLYKKSLSRWERIVGEIKKTSNLGVVEKLKISYDGLDSNEQEIFLDIACFFRGENRENVVPILKSCDFSAEYGLDVLIDKSLVFIDEHNRIEMHDLIEGMGRYVVKMQKHPCDRSRLWDAEDFKQVMADNTGSMAVEAIWLTSPPKQPSYNNEAMKNMTRLRILYIYDVDREESDIEYLPNNLRWFVWYDYPCNSLPQNFMPSKLVHLQLQGRWLHHLWNQTKVHLPCLRMLDLSYSKRLTEIPDFSEMPNLEYLDLSNCRSLQELHPSLRCCRKLKSLDLEHCGNLVRFAYINVESLQYLNLIYCCSLKKFPEILGLLKPPELEIRMQGCWGIRELSSSFFQFQAHLTKLDLKECSNFVSLSSSICMLKGLVKLDVSWCKKLETLPEEIGDLENLEELNARNTLISQPPSSIVRLNKLKVLDFAKFGDSENFVFPQLNGGLRSLEILNLSGCNLIDGGLPEDIGCLSSLQELYLHGNNFEHLPQRIARLGALRSLDLRECKRLKELPGFPEQLDTIYVDWSNDWMCNSLFQNISSLQYDISASDSLSLRVFRSRFGNSIPSWFHHWGSGTSVSVNLPENWYISDNLLGFAVCYYGRLIDITAHLIPLCDDGMSSMTRKLSLSNNSEYLSFFLLPLSGLWDPSKANGKTPNDYGCIMFSFSKEMNNFGFRLMYKDEAAEHCIGTKRSRDEASCSSSQKQRSQVEPLVSPKTLQLCPTSPEFRIKYREVEDAVQHDKLEEAGV